MATTNHTATKMIFEYVDAMTEKKTGYTFPYLNKETTDLQFSTMADSLNTLQNTPYTSLIRKNRKLIAQ